MVKRGGGVARRDQPVVELIEQVGDVLPVAQRLRRARLRDARGDDGLRGAAGVLRRLEVAAKRVGARGEVGVPLAGAAEVAAQLLDATARVGGRLFGAGERLAEFAQLDEILVPQRQVGQFADAQLALFAAGELVFGRVVLNLDPERDLVARLVAGPHEVECRRAGDGHLVALVVVDEIGGRDAEVVGRGKL